MATLMIGCSGDMAGGRRASRCCLVAVVVVCSFCLHYFNGTLLDPAGAHSAESDALEDDLSFPIVSPHFSKWKQHVSNSVHFQSDCPANLIPKFGRK